MTLNNSLFKIIFYVMPPKLYSCIFFHIHLTFFIFFPYLFPRRYYLLFYHLFYITAITKSANYYIFIIKKYEIHLRVLKQFHCSLTYRLLYMDPHKFFFIFYINNSISYIYKYIQLITYIFEKIHLLP